MNQGSYAFLAIPNPSLPLACLLGKIRGSGRLAIFVILDRVVCGFGSMLMVGSVRCGVIEL